MCVLPRNPNRYIIHLCKAKRTLSSVAALAFSKEVPIYSLCDSLSLFSIAATVYDSTILVEFRGLIFDTVSFLSNAIPFLSFLLFSSTGKVHTN